MRSSKVNQQGGLGKSVNYSQGSQQSGAAVAPIKVVVAPGAVPNFAPPPMISVEPTTKFAPNNDPSSMTANKSKENASKSLNSASMKSSDQGQNANQQSNPKEVLRLRYFRFKALDLEGTLDFYQTLGMNLDFKSEQSVWVNPLSKIKKSNTTNQTQGKSKKKDDEADGKLNHQAPLLNTPSALNVLIKKTVLGFSFKVPGSHIVDPNENMQLIFEKEIEEKVLS
jgi:hypothetical protein